MAQILVRNLEDEVVATFRRRAEAGGRSLEQELREVLRSAARPTGAELAAVAAEIASMTPGAVQGRSDSLELLRDDRGRDW
jgi:plasmid stability protein